MEVDPLLAGSGSSTSFATSSLAENFDTFLTLLTVQLQNQDPLDPLDTNEFTSQLVQFTAVEQAIATNNNLESLIGLTELSHAATRISYLGKEVEAPGSTSYLTDGKAEWSYVLDDEATDDDHRHRFPGHDRPHRNRRNQRWRTQLHMGRP